METSSAKVVRKMENYIVNKKNRSPYFCWRLMSEGKKVYWRMVHFFECFMLFWDNFFGGCVKVLEIILRN
jgi:hypothetical protein